MRQSALFSTKSSNRDDSLGYIHLLEPLYKMYDNFSGECFYYLSNLIKSYFAARGTLHLTLSHYNHCAFNIVTLPTPTLRRLLPRHARQLPRLLAFIAVWHRPKTLALHLKDERDRGLVL